MAMIPKGKVSYVKLRDLVAMGKGTYFIPHDTWPQVLCMVTDFKPGTGRCHDGMLYRTVIPQLTHGFDEESRKQSAYLNTLSIEELEKLPESERTLNSTPCTTGYAGEYKLMEHRLDTVDVWVVHDLSWYMEHQMAMIKSVLDKIVTDSEQQASAAKS